MKLLPLLSFAVLITLTSCQKEISWDSGQIGGGGTGGGGTGGGGTGGGTSGALVKRVSNSVADSVVELYTYTSGKITRQVIQEKDKLSGTTSEIRRTFTRDAQNRLTALKDSITNATGGWDVVSSQLYYAATGSNVLYSIATYGTTSQGRDSVVYTYTGNRITKTENYVFDSGSGTYTKEEEAVYTYDANGNITNVKDYEVSGATTTLDQERKYTYDTRVSPYNWGVVDVVLIGSSNGGRTIIQEDFGGPNNPSRIEFVDPVLGAGDGSAITYTYHSNNKPNIGTANAIVGGVTLPLAATVAHYYQ